jgi:hypothetical protein
MEVAETSSLPTFSTDLTNRVLGMRNNRFSVPFSDKVAQMDFYCICLEAEYKNYVNWFKRL